jgi:hypothetical protein
MCDVREQQDIVSKTLEERGKRHGPFLTHSNIAQCLKESMRVNRTEWEALDDDQKESLEMIAHKIARILNGDPNYPDSWVDIAGYATLVANRLMKEAKDGTTKP